MAYIHSEEGYAKYAFVQRASAVSCKEHITKSLLATDTVKGSCFTVCDYGAADGSSSEEILRSSYGVINIEHTLGVFSPRVMLNCCSGKPWGYTTLRPLVSHHNLDDNPWREYNQDCLKKSKNIDEMAWIYNDLPNTDYSLIYQANEEDNSGRNIFRLVSGKSFYGRVVPDESVDFGLCLTAIHWLSECVFTDADMYTEEKDNLMEEERQLAKERAAEDWENFLLYRAQELKQGGRMVVMVIAPKDDPYPYQLIRYTIIPQLLAEGKITMDEFRKLTAIRTFERNKDDVMEPFRLPTSAGTKAGLSLNYIGSTSLEELNESVPVTAIFGAMKSYMYSFLPYLSETRSADSAAGIVELIFQRAEQLFLKHPEKYVLAYKFHVAEVVKGAIQNGRH